MSDWVRFNDRDGSLISGYVQGYEARPTTLMAYYIRHKEDILLPTAGDFIGKYEHLRNNYGIYFLFGDERPIGGKKTIYIGQASEREDTKGMDRIREHLNKNNPDKYIDRWQSVLYITSYENDWSSGVLNTLEKLLIAVFKTHSAYDCLNTMDGRDGNVPEQDYRTILKYILDILAMPVFGYELTEIQKSTLRENIKESISEMLLTVREQQEKAVREELLDKYSREDITHLSWSKRVEIYDNFKQNLVGAHKYIYGDRIPFGSTVDEIITPDRVAYNMVYMIEPKHFNSKTQFLDIYAKSGVYLISILNRLMSDDPSLPINHEEEFIDKRKRLNHIIQNQLFGVCGSLELFLVTNAKLIEAIEGYVDKIHGTNKRIRDNNLILPKVKCIDRFRDIVKYNKSDSVIGLIKERFRDEREEELKFDVVIGNPPYNNDIYLDFVELGNKLADKCSCWITPAKWQAKTDGKPKGSKTPDKNEQFRQNIVPYMSKVVFYKDSTDVFDIQEWGGISYFLIDKEKHSEKLVKTVCNKNNALASDFEAHDEATLNLYSHKLLSLLGKVGTLGDGFKKSLYIKNTDHGEITIASTLGEGFKQSLYVKNTDHGDTSMADTPEFKEQAFVGEQYRGEALKQVGYVEVMQGEKVSGYKAIKDLFTEINLDKWKCICSIMPGAVSAFDSNGKVLGMFKISIIGPYQVPKGSFPVLMYFDTREECESFISYMNTRLISFLYYLGCCGTTLTKEFFRFVPCPSKFDHIFTDQELYEKYSLTEDEILIIESVIKERK